MPRLVIPVARKEDTALDDLLTQAAPPDNALDALLAEEQPEDTWGEVALKAVKSVPGRFLQGAGGVLESAEEALVPGGPGMGRDIAEVGRLSAEKHQPNVQPGSAKSYVHSAAASTAQNIPYVVGGILLKNPQLALGGLSAQVYGEKFHELKRHGQSNATSVLGAAGYAAAEYIGEKIPIGALFKEGWSPLKKALGYVAADIPGEMVTEILQVGVDAGIVKEDMTLGQAWDRVVDAGIVATIAAPMQGAIVHPAAKLADKYGPKVSGEPSAAAQDTALDDLAQETADILAEGEEMKAAYQAQQRERRISEITDKTVINDVTYGKFKDEIALSGDAAKIREELTELARVHPQKDFEEITNPGTITSRILAEARQKMSPEDYKAFKSEARTNLAVYEEVHKNMTPAAAEQASKKRPQPKTFLSWVKSKGGIWDNSLPGETAQFGPKDSRIVGLVSRKTGLAFDELAAQAVSEGWLPEGSSTNEFISLLNTEIAAVKAKLPQKRAVNLFEGENKAVETEIKAHDDYLQELADTATEKGFDFYGPEHTEQVGNLKKGDKLLIEGEEYEHQGYDKDGNAILADGETYYLDPFETVRAEAVKKGEFRETAPEPRQPVEELKKEAETAAGIPAELKGLSPSEQQIMMEIKEKDPDQYGRILKGNTAKLVQEWEAKRRAKSRPQRQEGMFGKELEKDIFDVSARLRQTFRITEATEVVNTRGETITLPKGEEYTAYPLEDGKVRLQDGKQVTVYEGELAKLKGQILPAGEQPMAGGRIHRAAWSDETAEVGVHTTIAKLKSHPDYQKAKAGDQQAALRLARDLLKPQKIRELKGRLGNAEKIIIVPVRAMEANGDNAIPLMAATVISEHTGWAVDEGIIQVNKVFHTGAKALERVYSQAEFDGPVGKGADYILIDDVITTGQTIANLKGFIEARGGKVRSIQGLAAAQFSTKLRASKDTLGRLRDVYGQNLKNVLENIYGEKVNETDLTESEARTFIAKKDGILDRTRKAISKRGNKKGNRDRQGVLQEESGGEITLDSFGLQNIYEHTAKLLKKVNPKAAQNVAIVKPQDQLGLVNALLASPGEMLGRARYYGRQGKNAGHKQDRLRGLANEKIKEIFGPLKGKKAWREFADTSWMGEIEGCTYTPEELDEMGVSPTVKDAYLKHRRFHEQARRLLAAHRKAYGGETGHIVGHLPHLFENWNVYEMKEETAEDGGVREVPAGILGTFRSLREATLFANGLSPDKNYRIKPKTFHMPDELIAKTVMKDASYFKLVEKMEEAFSLSREEAFDMTNEIARRKNRRRFLGNLMKRTGQTGFRKDDLQDILKQYYYSVARYVALDDFKAKVTPQFEKDFGVELGRANQALRDRNMAEYIQEYIDDVLGVPGKYEKLLDASIKRYMGTFVRSERPTIWMVNKAMHVTAVMKLGFLNLSAGMVNLTQLVNTFSKVPVKHFAWALGEAMRPSPQSRGILRRIGVQFDLGLADTGGYSMTHKAGKLVRASMFFFSGAEHFIRRVTALAAYRQARKDLGMSEKQARKQARFYARYMVDKTQFDYSVADTAQIFRSPHGRLLGQFKPWTVKQIEFTLGLKGAENIKFWIPMLLMGGMYVIPLIAGLAELIEWLTGKNPLLETKAFLMRWAGADKGKKAVAETVMYGVGSQLGVDVSQRVGTGDIIPARTSDLLGPTINTMLQAKKLLEKGDLTELARSLAPSVGNVATAIETAVNGMEVRDPYRRERLKYKARPSEVAIKAVGLRPVREAEMADVEQVRQYETRKYTRLQQRYIDEAVEALKDGQAEEFARAITKAAGKGVVIDDRMIENEIVQKALPQDVRMLLKTRAIQRGDYLESLDFLGDEEQAD